MEIDNIGGKATLNNGIKMPVLGLGVYKAKEGKEVINAVSYALEAGYRHIDTASFYHNEEGVGKAVETSGISKKDIFVTTKVWNDDHGYENTLSAFDKSLKELKMDTVDLYLIHWPVPGLYLETWRALEKLYREDRVKAIGLSNCLEHHVNDVLENCEIPPMVLQNEFHPRLVQQSLIDFCQAKDIQYQAWAPLMRGKILQNETLIGLAEKYQKTVAQVLIRWDLQKGVISIPKSVHRERILENADVFDFTLSAEDIQLIDALDRGERTGAHPDNFMEHFKNA